MSRYSGAGGSGQRGGGSGSRGGSSNRRSMPLYDMNASNTHLLNLMEQDRLQQGVIPNSTYSFNMPNYQFGRPSMPYTSLTRTGDVGGRGLFSHVAGAGNQGGHGGSDFGRGAGGGGGSDFGRGAGGVGGGHGFVTSRGSGRGDGSDFGHGFGDVGGQHGFGTDRGGHESDNILGGGTAGFSNANEANDRGENQRYSGASHIESSGQGSHHLQAMDPPSGGELIHHYKTRPGQMPYEPELSLMPEPVVKEGRSMTKLSPIVPLMAARPLILPCYPALRFTNGKAESDITAALRMNYKGDEKWGDVCRQTRDELWLEFRV